MKRDFVTRRLRCTLKGLLNLSGLAAVALVLTHHLSSSPPVSTGLNVDTYQFKLAAGEFLHVVVKQNGTDLVAKLFDFSGEELLTVDGPTGDQGAEEVSFIAPISGTYRIELRALSAGAPERHLLSAEIRRTPTPADRQRAIAARFYHEAERLRKLNAYAARERAVDAYTRAIRLYAALGDRHQEADTRFNLGRFLVDLGADSGDFDPLFQSAESLYGELKLPWLQATCLHYLGRSAYHRGDWQRAYELHSRSLPLRRVARDTVGEAQTANELALASQYLGRSEEAFEWFEHAQEIWDYTEGWDEERARVLHNQGLLYASIGLRRRALASLRASLEIQRRLPASRDLAATLSRLGLIQAELGEVEAAEKALNEALALRRNDGDRRGEAVTLNHFGVARWLAGDVTSAARVLKRAQELFLAEGELREEARTLQWLGRVTAAVGPGESAAEYFEKARRAFAQIDDPAGSAANWLWLARFEYDRGRLEAARNAAECAVEEIERLLPGAESYDFSSAFQADKQHFYDLLVDVLVALHRRYPGEGFADMALVADDRGRARALLALLPEGRATTHARAEVQLLDAEGIYELVDAHTALVAFRLGVEQSRLFLVTVDGLDIIDLPPRAQFEELARQAHRLLSRRDRRYERRREQVLQKLSSLLLDLGDRVERLRGRRWMLLLDGALHYVPFAALPSPFPGEEGVPLGLGHETIRVPSAATLEALRQRGRARASTVSTVAVVSDPVFGPSDEDLRRLVHSGYEADAIRALVPAKRFSEWRGFEATAEMVLDGSLRGFSIVHFATHGHFDFEHPGQSRLYLSHQAADGRPLAGELTARQVSGLELDAELVVLSACQTAMGTERRGEGLAGLTQSFLDAGASRVLVSLWRVEEEATAAFMAAFYRALLSRPSADPAAALRKARSEIVAVPRWRDPNYWAGFVLVGDSASLGEDRFSGRRGTN